MTKVRFILTLIPISIMILVSIPIPIPITIPCMDGTLLRWTVGHGRVDL